MPLLSAIKSREEIYEEAQNNPLVQTLEHAILDGMPFFKKLSYSTLRSDERLDQRWLEFYLVQVKKGNPWAICSKITVGVALPPKDAFVGFSTYLALTTQGRLGSQYPAKATIKNYMNNLFGLFRRNALLKVPNNYRQQCFAFIDSADLQKIVPLVTRMRAKHIASTRDVTLFIRGIWDDRSLFRTNRMRIQLCLFILLSSLSTERPGAIVESACYRGTNQALVWEDIQVHIVPNPDDPQHPYVFIRIRINLLKRQRENDSAFKDFVLFADPDPNRVMCPVSLIIALGIEDGLWKHVRTAGEIFCPSTPPTQHHQLDIVETWAKVPVLRREVLVDGIWSTHPRLALQYDCVHNHFRHHSAFLGWRVPLTCYCLRRGAANRASKIMNEEERTNLLGHIKNAMEFVQSYQSRQITYDLSSIFHGREQNHAELQTAGALTDMSSRNDPNAPAHLPLAANKALLQEEELVELRKEREKLKKHVNDVYQQLDDLETTLEENGILVDNLLDEHKTALDTLITLQAQAESLSAHLAEFDRIYKNLVARNAYSRLPQYRKDYFAGQSEHQLSGMVAPMPIKMHRPTRGKENLDSLPLITNMVTIDPLDQLVSVYINGSQKFPTISDSVMSFVNAVLDLPTRPFPTCYAGEFPTERNTCPVCDEVCGTKTMPRGVGPHIHKCITQQMQSEAQEKAERTYVPARCSWKGCTAKTGIYTTRQSFLSHVAGHCARLGKPSIIVDSAGLCGLEEHDDWTSHFVTEHGINLRSTIEVDFCYLCTQFFVDEVGDRSAWEDHLIEHYDNHFRAFEDRAEEDRKEFPTNDDVQWLEHPRAIQYAHGAGFATGTQPEIHGYFADRIILIPARCPFCLYNRDAPISVRMYQWIDPGALQRHLQGQHLDGLEGQEHQCPIPSCGVHMFSYVKLLEHLVAYHRVPVCGTTIHRLYRGLLLPVVDDNGFVVQHSKWKRKTKAAPQTDSEEEEEAPPKRGKKVSRDAYWCFGCSQPLQDIGKHMRGAKLESKCRRIATGEFSGERLSWVFSTDISEAGQTAKKGRNHYCITHCKAFPDIREHMPEMCQTKYFRIKENGRGPVREAMKSAYQTVQESTSLVCDLGEGFPQEIRNVLASLSTTSLQFAEEFLQ
ncbi:hypothetical protein ARMSODRAFT_970671 [Armillaria solidipes]|uniref:C2H2-type domain-containing protein n=1 Tax=Armillaria solidipes TaxID=1076256 RepID=A0A2H3CCT9_9AGAR|nr:hypothetical protein ARMSODRAFT_970671 [Armillaria solidipes]